MSIKNTISHSILQCDIDEIRKKVDKICLDVYILKHFSISDDFILSKKEDLQ